MLLYPCRCAARPRDPKIKPRAFLSHTEQTLRGEHEPCAPRLAREVSCFLSNKELSFYDVDTIRKGFEWAPQIVEGVKSCSVFVAILTPAYSQRFWPMYELYLALEAAKKPKSKHRILPVLYGTNFNALRQNFEKSDPWAKWKDHESKEKVIQSSVKNLNNLSDYQAIRWTHDSFNKNNIATFGKRVAEAIEDLLCAGCEP